MVPRQKSSIAQISFVIHIKIDQYPSLRSVPRATSKSHESKNKQILQPLSKSCPSIYMTYLRVTTKTNKSSNHCFIICCGQGLVVSHCLIICCGQGLVASYCFITFATKTKFHSPKRAFRAILSFAVVQGWWSAIVLSFPVVRGWWPAIVLSHLPPKPNFIVQNERFARAFLQIS